MTSNTNNSKDPSRTVWMLTKWYPNREDPQFGVFIKKHARAIALKNQISVLYIHSSIKVEKTFEVFESENAGVYEVIVYFRRNRSIIKKLFNLVRYLIALRKGIRLLKKRSPNPDFIHSYILTRPAIFGWYYSRRLKIPHVISEQWSGFLTGKFLTGNMIKKIITRNLIKNASAVSSVSNFLYKRMNECGLRNSNYHVIPNIIETPGENSTAGKKNYIYLLIVADLVDEIKNISGVLRAINSIEFSGEFRLHIIGHGPDELRLKKLATDLGLMNKKVFFEGLKANDEVYRYLNICDFLVMNSRYETFSLICAEAMSCGKPVLATRCGGPNEFVNLDAGILIEPDNESELKSKLIYMLNNYMKYDSNKIKNHVRNIFSQEHVSDAFQNFYKTAIDGERPDSYRETVDVP